MSLRHVHEALIIMPLVQRLCGSSATSTGLDRRKDRPVDAAK